MFFTIELIALTLATVTVHLRFIQEQAPQSLIYHQLGKDSIHRHFHLAYRLHQQHRFHHRACH